MRGWRRLAVLVGLAIAAACTAAGPADQGKKPSSEPSGYHVDASRGDDDNSGSSASPWKTLEPTEHLPPGSVVYVAPGRYSDAPNAEGVEFRGAEASGAPERVIEDAVSLKRHGTRIVGFRLTGGLDFSGDARDNLVDRCVIEDHWGVWGEKDAAPRNNRITNSKLRVHVMEAHTYGDDRDRTVPRIVRPTLETCDVTVERSGGVLWRWSGVDDARITHTTIRLVNGGHHNDDDASWKWFYTRRARITDSRIILDNRGDFGETGPFAPMWRDSTWGIQMIRTTVEAPRGNFIFSANTSGTWVCSCGGHHFEDVVLRAPGKVWLYQCPKPPSDTWARSEVQAGTYESYNSGQTPQGLRIRKFTAKASSKPTKK